MDPFTIGMMAMQTMGSLMQGGAQASALKAQAAVDEENGRRALLAGEQEGAAVRRDARQVIGDQLAMQGGSGTLAMQGSNRDVLVESAMQAEMDIYNLRKRASYEDANARGAAADKRAGAKAAVTQSLFKATSNILGGISEQRSTNRLMESNDRWRQSQKAGYGTGYGGRA